MENAGKKHQKPPKNRQLVSTAGLRSTADHQ